MSRGNHACTARQHGNRRTNQKGETVACRELLCSKVKERKNTVLSDAIALNSEMNFVIQGIALSVRNAVRYAIRWQLYLLTVSSDYI